MIPVIETARLRLRAHRREDLPDCVAMWADPNVVRLITGKPSTEQQTWARLLTYLGHWETMGFGYWLAQERESGAFVGEVGLADFKRDVAPWMRGLPDIGFALASRFHGRGFATEAAQSVLAWADANLEFDRTLCVIDPANAASLRVAEKCGYEIIERGMYNEQPTLFLARARRNT